MCCAPDQALRNRELGERIREAIAQLSPEHRTVVLLREVEGMSYEEIAEVTESQTGTAPVGLRARDDADASVMG